MILDKTQIAELVPHGPGMSLIDRVIECDAEHIVCATDSHRSENNPLLSNRKLASIILVEYASQAAAIHAALNRHEFTQGKPAFIGSIKNVTLACSLLDGTEESLLISAKCTLSSLRGAIYEFSISQRQILTEGQINLIRPA